MNAILGQMKSRGEMRCRKQGSVKVSDGNLLDGTDIDMEAMNISEDREIESDEERTRER